MNVDSKIKKLKEELERILHEKTDLQLKYEAELSRLRKEAQKKEARISDLQNSLSWRITSPLRTIGSALNFKGAKPEQQESDQSVRSVPPPAPAAPSVSPVLRPDEAKKSEPPIAKKPEVTAAPSVSPVLRPDEAKKSELPIAKKPEVTAAPSVSPVLPSDEAKKSEPPITKKPEVPAAPKSVAQFTRPKKVHDELLVYLDPGFFSDWGHYTNFATCIHEEANKREIDLWHFSTADVAIESIDQFSLIPFFEYRAMLAAEAGFMPSDFVEEEVSILQFIDKKVFDKETIKVLLSFRGRVEAILEVLKSHPESYRKVSFYLYTGHPLYVWLLAELISDEKFLDMEISFHLGLFYLNLDFCQGKKVPGYESLLKIVGKAIESLDPKNKIKIYADSNRTIDIYSTFFKRPILVSPIPLLKENALEEKLQRNSDTITIGFFGFAHPKQGYHLFKELYDYFISNSNYKHVNFIVRHNLKHSPMTMKLISKIFQTKNDRTIHLPGNFISAKDYEDHLNKCDIVLIPHSIEHYPCQTSGIFTDSIIKRKIVVVPKDTWMSDQLVNFGTGETFISDNALDFIEVTKHILDNFNDYDVRRDKNVKNFSGFHSSKGLFDILNIGGKNPCDLEVHKIGLSKFKDLHKGKRCFVVGNGPSLNLMDLSRLEGEYVICTNSIFLLFDRVNWRPQYYTCVDTRVLPDQGSKILEMHEKNPEMVCFFPCEIKNHQTQEITLTKELIPPGKNRIYFEQHSIDKKNLPFSAFPLDLEKGLAQPYTVTITALQLAVYMGFDPIYLIGCDTSYSVPDNVIKEGDHPELGKFMYTSTEDNDPNHFDPTYFGKGRQWHHPQVHNMIWHYMMAHEVVALSGKHIFNATAGGKLEVFPRVDFEELFK